MAPRARFELATLRLTAECSTVELPGIRANIFIFILVQPSKGCQFRRWFRLGSNGQTCRTFLVKSRNRRTDFQRLRRNALRENHDHSTAHRMLYSYERMEPARLRNGTQFWWLQNAKPPQAGRDRGLCGCGDLFL